MTRYLKVIMVAAFICFGIPSNSYAQTELPFSAYTPSLGAEITREFLGPLQDPEVEEVQTGLYNICMEEATRHHKVCVVNSNDPELVDNPAVVNDPVMIELGMCAAVVQCKALYDEEVLECGCLLPINQATPYCWSIDNSRRKVCELSADAVKTVCLRCERLTKNVCDEAAKEALKLCVDGLNPPPPPLKPLA